MSADIVSFLSDEVALNGFGIFVVASCLALLCRRCRAAVRHGIWSLAFGSALVLPLVSTSLPEVSISVPIGAPQQAPASGLSRLTLSDNPWLEVSPSRAVVPRNTQASQNAGAKVGGFQGEARSMTEPLLKGLVLAWMVVAGLFLVKLGADVWRMARWTRRAVTIERQDWTGLLKSLAAQIGVSRRIRLLASSDVAVPVTWGVRRPVILLPQEAAEWGDERRRVALLHEFNHIRRADYAWNVLGYLSRSMHWFNPLAWYAYHQLAIERERATDDCVLLNGAESHAYATYLLAGVVCLFEGRGVPRPANAMASSSSLRSRLQFILDDRVHRAPLSRLIAVLMLASAAAVVGAFAVADPTVVASDWRATVSVADGIVELESDDPTVRKRAAWVLGEREETRAVPHLIKALDDQDPEVRALAAWALGEIKEPTSVHALHRCLQDGDSHVREMVTLAVGEIEQPCSVATLTPLLAEPSREIRAAAVWALGEIGTTDALDAVVTALDDRDPRVRLRAVRTVVRKSEIAGVRPGAELRMPTLLRVLRTDGDARVRVEAANALGDMRDTASVAGLTAALSDPEATVRREAAWALGRLGHPSAVDALIQSLCDADPEVRWMVIWALDEIGQG